VTEHSTVLRISEAREGRRTAAIRAGIGSHPLRGRVKALLAAATLGLTLMTGDVFAVSENERLSCLKELPNPLGLIVREDYVLTCTTKVDDLSVSNVTANDGACSCRLLHSDAPMRANTRFMTLCRAGAKPCDFTKVVLETNAGAIVFTWDPDVDDSGF
jgi:hypothetical protein